MSLRYDEEPIAALATSQGRAAIAVIRLSGKGILDKLSVCVRSLNKMEPRKTYLRKIRDPRSNNAILDEAVIVRFDAGKSYTGQESVEIYCHGGPYIQQRILETLYAQGFRPADPGEFTRRAWLNGRMNLTEAEGIRELANATTYQQWLAASWLSSGKLGEKIENLRREVVEAMAYLEARIDFPDEGETSALPMEQITSRVARAKASMKNLFATYDDGRIASEGLSVALIGEPNAGKSTLLNRFLGRERAIVTDIAGTTRDYIEEPCNLRGRLVRLVDTAGIRESSDVIERKGIETSLQFLRSADIILALLPLTAGEREKDEIENWIADLPQERIIRVATKADLGKGRVIPNWLPLSCQTGLGLEALIQTLVERVDRSIARIESEPFVTTTRHKIALQNALAAIQRFEDNLAAGSFDEILAHELQDAAKALMSLIGSVDSEDLLDKIFRDFCIGK